MFLHYFKQSLPKLIQGYHWGLLLDPFSIPEEFLPRLFIVFYQKFFQRILWEFLQRFLLGYLQGFFSGFIPGFFPKFHQIFLNGNLPEFLLRFLLRFFLGYFQRSLPGYVQGFLQGGLFFFKFFLTSAEITSEISPAYPPWIPSGFLPPFIVSSRNFQDGFIKSFRDFLIDSLWDSFEDSCRDSFIYTFSGFSQDFFELSSGIFFGVPLDPIGISHRILSEISPEIVSWNFFKINLSISTRILVKDSVLVSSWDSFLKFSRNSFRDSFRNFSRVLSETPLEFVFKGPLQY